MSKKLRPSLKFKSKEKERRFWGTGKQEGCTAPVAHKGVARRTAETVLKQKHIPCSRRTIWKSA